MSWLTGERRTDPEGYPCRVGALWARLFLRDGWAMVAFGSVWFKNERTWTRYLASPHWRAHEHYHFEQLRRRFGGNHWRYLAAFVWQYVRYGGHDRAPLEIEAETAAREGWEIPSGRSSHEATDQVPFELPMPLEPLVTTEQIADRVQALAEEIRRDYGDAEILLICVLKGSFVFLADLCRRLGPNVKVDFMQVSSYGNGMESSGIVQIVKDADQSLEGRDVLIVEDIVDTGATLRHLRELLSLRQPRSLRVVALLSKPAARQVEVDVEYLGFEIPDEFVVGYGLDVAESFRNLPYVAVLNQEQPS